MQAEFFRNYLDKIDNVITESRGLGARSPGDRFISVDGSEDEMTFVGITFYPEDGSELTPEEMTASVEKYESEVSEVNWTNKQTSNSKVFGIAEFETPDGERWLYGRFFNDVKGMPEQYTWSNTNGIPGYRFDSKVAKKESSGTQPTEVLSNFENLTSKDILRDVVSKFGPTHPFVKAVKLVDAGTDFPFAIDAVDGMDISAYSNYFCEILHPIALQRGVYTGSAGDAARDFLGTEGFEDTTISFGTSKTEGLSDSLLIAPNGQEIKVSSKAGSGAAASVQNLGASIGTIKRAGKTKLLKSMASTIEIVDIIQNNGQYDGPIELALHVGLINNKEATQIRELQAASNSREVNHKNVLNGGYLTPRMQKLYAGRQAKDPTKVNPFFHMLSALVSKTADKINKGNFPADAAKILNHAALVQVHTKAIAKGGKWIVQDFSTKYPGTLDIRIALHPSKAYSSTAIKGKLTFKILSAGEKIRDYYVDHEAKAAGRKKQATKVTARGKKTVSAPAGRAKR